VKLERPLSGILNHAGAKSFDLSCDAKRRAEIDLVLARHDAPAVHRQLRYMFAYCRRMQRFPFSGMMRLCRPHAAAHLRVLDGYADADAFTEAMLHLAVDQSSFRAIMEHVYAYHNAVRSLPPYRAATAVLTMLRRKGVI
jgi:hypothetical protein